MIRRKRIGSVLTESPAARVKRHFSNFTIKLIYAIIATAFIYVLFEYLIFNLINFMIENIQMGEPITNRDKVYMLSMILVMLLTDYYIMKDSLRKR